MLSFLVAAAMWLLPCVVARAGEAIEAFEYPGGLPLAEVAGGEGAKGWSGGWRVAVEGAAAAPDDVRIAPESLESAAFESCGLRAQGNKATFANLSALATFSRKLAVPVDFRDNRTIYIGFLARWSKNIPNPASRFRFQDSEGRTFAGFFGDGTTPNGMILQTRMNGQDTSRSKESFPAGETYFVVIKIQASASGTDTISIVAFRPDGTVGDEPAEWMASSSFASNNLLEAVAFSISLYLKRAPENVASLDEIRIGSTWDEVTRGR